VIGTVEGAARLALPEAGGHVLLLTGDGRVQGWGDNSLGQLGAGDIKAHQGWVESGLSGVVDVAAGAAHSVALLGDGTVQTWGANHQGQLGDGSLVSKPRPVAVAKLRNVTMIAAGRLFTLALRADGTVWGFGSNWAGLVPGDARKMVAEPAQIQGLSGIQALAVSQDQAYAKDSQGRIWVWGNATSGPRELGSGASAELVVELERQFSRSNATAATESVWHGNAQQQRQLRVGGSQLSVTEGGKATQYTFSGAVVDVRMGWSVGLITRTASTAGGAAGIASRTSSTRTLAAPPPVAATSVTPNTGTGAVQTFSGVFSDAGGYHNLQWVQMLFAISPTGGGQSFCFVHYDVQGNALWLYGDDVGFFVGPITPGTSSNKLQGTLCAVNTQASSVVGSGNTLTVNLDLVFKAAGARNIYSRAQDLPSAANTDWVLQGTWTLVAATLGTPSVSPNSGSSNNGTSQTFTLTYPDPPGFAGEAFGWEQFLIKTATNAPFCFVHYDRAGNALWMYSSDVGFFLGPVTPGVASGALSSSSCSLDTASTMVANIAGNLVLTVPITFKAPMVNPNNLFQRTLDVLNRDTGFEQTGTWTIN
jgi:hypothetical protein